MRKLFFILVVLAVIFCCPVPSQALDDAIIAVVNDEVITLKDLRSYIHSTYVSFITEGMDQEQAKQLMLELEINGLDRLIEDKLILSRANKINLTVKDKLIEERLNEIKKKYPSEDFFLEALIRNGASITDLREKIREQLKLKFIVEYEVKKKVFVNPKEVTDYYEKHPDQFIKKERANLDSIFIAFKNDKEKAREKIDAALNEIKGGKDFREVAAGFSDAPSLGTVEKGQTLPVVDNTVFNLQDGEVSPVVEVDAGFYLFKLLEKSPSQKAALNEVKDKVHNVLYRQKFKKEYEKWIAKLKKEAYIEIKK